MKQQGIESQKKENKPEPVKIVIKKKKQWEEDQQVD